MRHSKRRANFFFVWNRLAKRYWEPFVFVINFNYNITTNIPNYARIQWANCHFAAATCLKLIAFKVFDISWLHEFIERKAIKFWTNNKDEYKHICVSINRMRMWRLQSIQKQWSDGIQSTQIYLPSNWIIYITSARISNMNYVLRQSQRRPETKTPSTYSVGTIFAILSY